MNGATSLLSLDCSQNYLIDIDISGTPCLTSLVCRENNLMQLDVSRNHYLTQLHSLNNLSLREIWLNTGQTADDIQKDEHTILKYK
jgi:Leucine-rich repeat (LRR) protein